MRWTQIRWKAIWSDSFSYSFVARNMLVSAEMPRDLASWRSRVEQAWPRLRVESVEDSGPEIDLGKYLEVSARVFLDSLTPDDVMVECAFGRVSADGEIENFWQLPCSSASRREATSSGASFDLKREAGCMGTRYGSCPGIPMKSQGSCRG